MIEREIVEGPGLASDGTVVKSGQIYTRAEAMADIVERLRVPVMLHSDAAQTNAERREAAAEIERLRGEISYLTDEVIPALKAEAERAHEQKGEEK